MSLCLAAGALVVELGVNAATLSWTHSVEKTVWEEDWGETLRGLVIEEARVQGSGAGMDPPPQARLENGTWRWRPVMVPLPEVVLRRSGATADWRICMKGKCRPMGDFVSGEVDPVILRACGAASVLNLKFATLIGSIPERTSNSKSTLESISSSVAYDSEIRSQASINMRRISESPH